MEIFGSALLLAVATACSPDAHIPSSLGIKLVANATSSGLPTASTAVILVSRADSSALREAERTRVELAELGVSNLQLALNGRFTLPEATPVHEAERLQADLARARIQPLAWVINQSLLASGTHHPLLAQRGRYEIPFIRRVADSLSSRCALIPWLPEAPVGARGLAQLTQ